MLSKYKVIVIGGGPGGLAAATSASKNKASVLLIEREAKLGGILKQCIHDGFGLTRFKEKLSGPEYAQKEIDVLSKYPIDVSLLTFVTKIEKVKDGFRLHLVTRQGIKLVRAEKLILATGCRERTSKQVLITGTNPSGVLSAGTAQYYINILGKMPTKKCVILGSGDIGMIMARRISLEGGKVLGVYEVMPTPSGLTRNMVQCLQDYNIPLYLSTTVTRVFGEDRLEAVEVAKVDKNLNIIKGSEKIIKCDALILSVGLIPENELASSIGVELNSATKGPKVDQSLETTIKGIYSCGNALHVSDLADYVSESGEIAGYNAATNKKEDLDMIEIVLDKNISYTVPTYLNKNRELKTVMYFRVKSEMKNKTLHVRIDDKEVLKRKYMTLRPPEMQRIVLDLTRDDFKKLHLTLEDE